jgi:hypothetical protein
MIGSRLGSMVQVVGSADTNLRAILLFSLVVAFESSAMGCSSRRGAETGGTGGVSVGGAGSGGLEGVGGHSAGMGGSGFGAAGFGGVGAAAGGSSSGGTPGGGGVAGAGAGRGGGPGGSSGTGGTLSGVSYCGAFYSGGLDHATIQQRDTVRSLCITLALGSPVAIPGPGLTLPPTWGLAFGSVATLSSTGCGLPATQASALTGSVSWVPPTTNPPLAADVDIVMTFPPGDAGLPAPEHLRVQGVDMRAGCPP